LDYARAYILAPNPPPTVSQIINGGLTPAEVTRAVTAAVNWSGNIGAWPYGSGFIRIDSGEDGRVVRTRVTGDGSVSPIELVPAGAPVAVQAKLANRIASDPAGLGLLVEYPDGVIRRYSRTSASSDILFGKNGLPTNTPMPQRPAWRKPPEEYRDEDRPLTPKLAWRVARDIAELTNGRQRRVINNNLIEALRTVRDDSPRARAKLGRLIWAYERGRALPDEGESLDALMAWAATVRQVQERLGTIQETGALARARNLSAADPRSLYRQLLTLGRRFGPVLVNFAKKRISITTPEIVIADPNFNVEVNFGPFQVWLHYGSFGLPTVPIAAFGATALSPRRIAGASDGHLTHPHVGSNGICFGSAAGPCRTALANLQLVVAFDVVYTLLTVYGGRNASPYAHPYRWAYETESAARAAVGVRGRPAPGPATGPVEACPTCDRSRASCICNLTEDCPECGAEFRYAGGETCFGCGSRYCADCTSRCTTRGCVHQICDDCGSSCVRCGDGVFCSNCVTSCDGCEEYYCDGCIDCCANCEDARCPGCLTYCDDCSESFCGSCYETHSRRCYHCDTYLCADHVTDCPSCGRATCDDCRIMPEGDGQAFCPACAVTCAACEEDVGSHAIVRICRSCFGRHDWTSEDAADDRGTVDEPGGPVYVASGAGAQRDGAAAVAGPHGEEVRQAALQAADDDHRGELGGTAGRDAGAAGRGGAAPDGRGEAPGVLVQGSTDQPDARNRRAGRDGDADDDE
jgi:hypothetical protein